jgi:hypothetical protein
VPSKYEPIRRALESHPEDEAVSLTWDDLEDLVGPLPASSSIRQWWANAASSHQAQSWLRAGRRVAEVRLGRSVVFSPAGELAGVDALAAGSSGASLATPRRTRGLTAVMDGIAILGKTLERAGYNSTLDAVAAYTLFLHPDTVDQTEGQPLFPVIRNPNRRGELTIADGRQVMFDGSTR